MRRAIDKQLADLASNQHRVFSRAQAFLAGATDREVDGRVAGGEWVLMANGVYHFRGAAPDWYGVAQAALFDAGDESMIGHGASARVHRYPGYWRNGVEILVPRALDHRCEIAVVHESRRFDLIPTTTVKGLRVATPEATLLLLAGNMRMARLNWLTDELIGSKTIDIDRLRHVRDTVCGRGVAGSTIFRAVVEDHLPGKGVPESRLERMVLELCDTYGIRRPEVQAAFPGREHLPERVDFLFRPERLILEADGRRWHTRVADFERDHRRDLRAAAAGYRTARLTHLMLRYDAAFVASELRTALRHSAA